MSMGLDLRQRAMLAEMGVRVFAPPARTPVLQSGPPARETQAP